MSAAKKHQGEFEEVIIQQKQVRIKVLACELEKRLKAVALSIPREAFALVNDKSYSYVSEILNTNSEEGQKPYQVKLIPSLTTENPDKFTEEVINWLCDLCGREHPEKRKEMTPEEELRLLKRKIREHKLESIFEEAVGA